MLRWDHQSMIDQPVKFFSTPAAWRAWLVKNHEKDGVWLRFYKKGTGKKSMTYGEALDEALCFGWIDGQSKSEGVESWKQRFTPRREKSMWSKTNREHVARLIKEKKMTKVGMRAIEAAKKDGRWESAYDSPKNMEVPADFLKELRKDKKAYEFFKTLSKANVYAVCWRLATAKKPETRAKRMKVLLAMLSHGKKFH